MPDPVRHPMPPGFVFDGDVPSYRLYTARETAETLGVSERTVRRWIEAGRLSAEKEGGEFRIDIGDARVTLAGSRSGRSSPDAYVQWLERENERLWGLLERAVSRG